MCISQLWLCNKPLPNPVSENSMHFSFLTVLWVRLEFILMWAGLAGDGLVVAIVTHVWLLV